MKITENTSIDAETIAKLKAHVYDIVGCCQEVHRELGPWLNEYVYQEALMVLLQEKNIPFIKEYYFQVSFHGHPLPHKHYMDFLCKDNVVVECKAIASIGNEQRQQLWNYMRLANKPIGILYNFAPVKDQCEKYYYDVKSKTISAF
ncbi:GxxExxY protein [Xylanibacter brevis]|uniref:GxxExxY protein n=1 Tax=Xylanibacter brevis TaxID=83231 RepID=UPI0005C4B0F7|nr:GxxExxY protein [Xylanibacter brevis]